jgi:carnosine N-methyltransferase
MDINKSDKIAGIPIYIEDKTYFASEAYSLYTQLINSHKNQALNLTKAKPKLPERAEALDSIQKAILFNLETLIEIQSQLEPYVDAKTLVSFRPNPSDDLSGYLKDFRYLKRDWGWEDSSEDQLKAIKTAIEKSLSQLLMDNDSALFLGAGVGRIAYDLAHLFNKVYATDKSFSMAYHYYKLLNQDIDFYEIDYKNIYSWKNSTKKINATLSPRHLTANQFSSISSKINYFIGDVVRLPFPDNSVSAIFSVYFTDVIAIKLWLPEIKRVLKKDGLFIHFGPLDYFFSDPAEMLSAQELIAVFENNGFLSIHDQLIDTVHLPSSNVFVNKSYTNWHYVTRKENKIKDISIIDLDTNVEIMNPVEYIINGVIDNDGYNEVYELHMPDGEIYEGAQNVIEIVRLIKGKIKVNTIVQEMRKIYGELDADNVEAVKNVLSQLLLKKVIRVV